jgi:hypothetical protein
MRTFFLFSILCLSFVSCDTNDTLSAVQNVKELPKIEIAVGNSNTLNKIEFYQYFQGQIKSIALKANNPAVLQVITHQNSFEVKALTSGDTGLSLIINKKQSYPINVTAKYLPIKSIKPLSFELDFDKTTEIHKATIQSFFENGDTIKRFQFTTPSLEDSLSIIEKSNSFLFTSTRKKHAPYNIGLTLNDSLQVIANVGIFYNLFPMEIGDIWKFKYTYSHGRLDTRPYPLGQTTTEGIVTWKLIQNGSQIQIEESTNATTSTDECGEGFNPITGLCNIVTISYPFNGTEIITGTLHNTLNSNLNNYWYYNLNGLYIPVKSRLPQFTINAVLTRYDSRTVTSNTNGVQSIYLGGLGGNSTSYIRIP